MLRQMILPPAMLIPIIAGCACAVVRAEDGPDSVSLADLKRARKAVVRQPRKMIYNDDNVDAQTRTPEEFIAARLRHMPGTQVDLVTFDPFSMDNIAIWPSKVSEVDKEMYPLFISGYDPVALALSFCHEHEIEFYPSFRMNDIHESRHKEWWRTAVWKREHPEYLLGKHGDNHRYPPSSPRAWWAAKNYEVPEVRERQFLVIQEICEDYDIDGIELDWFRSPMFFRSTLDLRPVEARHVRIMTDFVRRIRDMTERVGQKRGRPIPIACRVPMSVECSLAVGLDLKTWLEEDLVDMMILGGGYAPMAMAPSVKKMVEFCREYDAPTFACISASGMKDRYGRDNVESWRGAAMNIHHAGAGVYLFNVHYGLKPLDAGPKYHKYRSSPRQVQLYKELGSIETLKGTDKIYAVDSIVKDTFEGDLRPGLVVPGRLPAELRPGKWTKIVVPVGEDIVSNAPDGKQAHVRLHVGAKGLSLEHRLGIRLNGSTISPQSSQAQQPLREQANADFESDRPLGDKVPVWRSSGYDGNKHVGAKFVVSARGRNGSHAGLLEVEVEHAWAYADQVVPVQVDADEAVEFSVWLRADKQRTRTHLALCLLLPERQPPDVARIVADFNVGTQWKEYRAVLNLGTVESSPASLADAQVRTVVQVYQRGPVQLYVDDANLRTGVAPQVDFNVDPSVVGVGGNEVEVKLNRGSAQVDRLELILSYKPKP
jgi:hypothetical protein